MTKSISELRGIIGDVDNETLLSLSADQGLPAWGRSFAKKILGYRKSEDALKKIYERITNAIRWVGIILCALLIVFFFIAL